MQAAYIPIFQPSLWGPDLRWDQEDLEDPWNITTQSQQLKSAMQPLPVSQEAHIFHLHQVDQVGPTKVISCCKHDAYKHIAYVKPLRAISSLGSI